MTGASSTVINFKSFVQAENRARNESPVKYSLNLPFKKQKAAEIDYQNLRMAQRIIYSKPNVCTKNTHDKQFK